jgi:broad specificity phosphatase PhoE
MQVDAYFGGLMQQAKALGESFKSLQIDAIFASDLLRAHWTVGPNARPTLIRRKRSANITMRY